ncbi:MAG: hypothetical protein JKY56_13600 [Kofleriaceae bacterium]|nr:hypothetical protein [Kofleriaceae bacterium]
MPDVPRTCVPGKLLGETCDLSECVGNTRCTDGTCQQDARNLGESCGVGFFNRCLYPLVCGIDNVCVNRPPPLVDCVPE